MEERYQLIVLSAAEVTGWDDLLPAGSTGYLFHRRVWLDCLAESRRLELRFYKLLCGIRSLNYLCGGVVRKGPFRVLDSPLKGWGKLQEQRRLHKAFSRTAKWARTGCQGYFTTRTQLRGWWQRMTHATRGRN